METKKPHSLPEPFKKIFTMFGLVLLSSFVIGVIGYAGHIIIAKVPLAWMWVFPLFIGTIVYIVLYKMSEGLRRTERVKSEFLTVAAHNLRTPLTKIQWLITDVDERIKDPEAKERFGDMKTSFKGLTDIVNRFLELAEAGKTSVYFSYLLEEQHIEYIVLQVIANLRLGIERKNIALATRIQQQLPPVSIDKERMQLVINILVENAILYNQMNGSIDIEISQENNQLICSITDTGIGISKEDLPNIFAKFFRAKDAVSIDTDRVGLELSLAKEIIHKHNGEIFVSSEGKGKGSRFWFTLPIAKKYLS